MVASGGPPAGGGQAAREAARQWASASARTLARRLRRRWVQAAGPARAVAIARRVAILRRGLHEHWSLCSSLGGHLPTLKDAIDGSTMLGVRVPDDVRELVAHCNWAKHAPPSELRAVPSVAFIVFPRIEPARSTAPL